MCGFEFPRLYTRTHPSPDSRKSFCQIPKVYIIPQASTYDWYISFRKAPGIRVLMRQSFRLTPAIYDETFRSPARIRVLFYGNTLLKWHVYDLDAYCKRRRNQRKQANIIEAFVLRVCEWAYCPMDQTRKIEEGGGGKVYLTSEAKGQVIQWQHKIYAEGMPRALLLMPPTQQAAWTICQLINLCIRRPRLRDQ